MGSELPFTSRRGIREVVRHGTVDIHCRVFGSGDALVLIHGWTLHQEIFRPQVAALSQHFRVITYDRRGCGLSRTEPDLAADLQDLNQVITTLGAGSAHVLGMSQGGRLALRFALSHPERVQRLVLQGAALDGFEPEDEPGEAVPMAEYAALVQGGRIVEMRERWIAHPLMHAGLASPEHRQLVREVVAGYQGRDLLKSGSGERMTADLQAAVKRLSTPTLLLTGRLETRSRRAHAQRLLELLPDAREIELERSGHLCNITEPKKYNDAVLAFCRGK